MNSSETSKIIPLKLFIPVVFIILALTVLFGSFYIVGVGQRGVLVTLGRASDISIDSGLHFKVPLVQSIVKFDVKTQKYEADASAASQDLQTVTTKMAINYHLLPETVPTLYRDIGADYSNRIIQPLEQEIVKATTAKFTAEELITKREQVREDIKQSLKDRLAPRGIIVEEVSITDFDFSKSFNDAIEAKVTAEQQALAAKNKLEQIKYEAEQQVTAAKGQAEAQALLARSVTKDTLEYQSLLNQKTAIDKWDGKLPSVTGGAIPFIDTTKFGGLTQ